MIINPYVFGGEPPPPSDYAAVILADSPIGYWRLGEATTADPLADETGNNDGTWQGGTLGEPGAIVDDPNTAYEPGGSYGSIPHDPSLALGFPFSIEFWFKHTATSNVVIIEKNGNPGISIQRSSSNDLVMNLGGTGSNARISTTTDANDGDWHHCVFIADPNGVGNRVFVDAVDDTNEAQNASPNTTTGPWYFGSRAGSFGYDGTLDEIAFYDYPLTALQVAEHYDAGIAA